MVSAVHGSLIETDIPCKVYILHINEQLPPAERFVIQDLDETHLLVQPHRLEYVKAEVKAWQQKNQFNPPADLRQTSAIPMGVATVTSAIAAPRPTHRPGA